MVLRDFSLDVSNTDMFLYEFKNSHINFIKKEHVKLDETCQDTQGHQGKHLERHGRFLTFDLQTIQILTQCL